MTVWDFIGPIIKAVLALLMGKDRQTGRDEQRAADDAAAAKVVEKQRDEANKPAPTADDLLQRMRDGEF